MKINVCIPVYNRYDLFTRCLKSLAKGRIKPDMVWLMNNGDLKPDTDEFKNLGHFSWHNPGKNIGLAKSWNWFIDNIQDVRIFCKDSVTFNENSLEELLNAYEDTKIIVPQNNSQACFIIPDKVIKKVGYFDEQISPLYAGYEDTDYLRRAQLHGVKTKISSKCIIHQRQNSTFLALSKEDKFKHQIKLDQAIKNYKNKWGGIPKKETFVTPFNLEE